MKFTKSNAKKYGRRGGLAAAAKKRAAANADYLDQFTAFEVYESGELIGVKPNGEKILLKR